MRTVHMQRLPGGAHARAALVLTLVLCASGVLSSQTPIAPETRANIRRAQATRAELEANLVQIDSILTSPGYSSRIRDAKRREQALISQRLRDGDLQVGDSLQIAVLGEESLSGGYAVGPGQTLVLPGLPDISLRGILRSEAEAHLTEQLRRFLRDPLVRVQTSIRLSILGAVGRPGFYQLPADLLVSDAIMTTGGPAGPADPNRTMVRRAGRTLLTEDDVREALITGATLDQLNLRAGDEVWVDQKLVRRPSAFSILGLISLASSISWLLIQIF